MDANHLSQPELLDEHIISRSGSYVRKRRWYRGAHPHLGLIHHGITGIETVQEVDVIVPMRTFEVVQPDE